MKKVCLVIEVPNSKYCFDGKKCCYYFNNEGGHGTCELNIGSITDKKDGLHLKPKECLQLKLGD